MKKLLSNRFAVVGLVVIALGSVLYNSRKELRRVFSPRLSATGKAVAAATEAVATPPVMPGVPAPTERPTIRRDVANSRQSRWLEAPDRDPFALLKPVAPSLGLTPAVKAESLRVSAIWRQAGQQFAIINGRLVREGEEAFGHTVERIEHTAVFLRHPSIGLVRADFPAFDRLSADKAATTTAANHPIPTSGRPSAVPPRVGG